MPHMGGKKDSTEGLQFEASLHANYFWTIFFIQIIPITQERVSLRFLQQPASYRFQPINRTHDVIGRSSKLQPRQDAVHQSRKNWS